jgi:hypothetical protein
MSDQLRELLRESVDAWAGKDAEWWADWHRRVKDVLAQPPDAKPVAAATVLWMEYLKDDGYHQRWMVEAKPNTLIGGKKLYSAPQPPAGKSEP